MFSESPIARLLWCHERNIKNKNKDDISTRVGTKLKTVHVRTPTDGDLRSVHIPRDQVAHFKSFQAIVRLRQETHPTTSRGGYRVKEVYNAIILHCPQTKKHSSYFYIECRKGTLFAAYGKMHSSLNSTVGYTCRLHYLERC